MKKLEKGMTVFFIPVGANNTRFKDSILNHIKESKISKIGRKYFYLEGYDEKFNISDLRYRSEHHFDLQAYLDKQDIFDEVEFKELETKIRNKLNAFGKSDLTLEQLKEIDKIIFSE